MPSCFDCVWLSSGWQDARGIGFCYAENEYVEEHDTCPFWQASLRDEPVNDPPERILAANVAEQDMGVDD